MNHLEIKEKSNKQLVAALNLAKMFLHLPLRHSNLTPLIVQHPFFDSSLLFDGDSFFDAFQDTERYNKLLTMYEEKVLNPCTSVSELVSQVRKSYRLAYLSFLLTDRIITLKECGNLLAEQWATIETINHDANVSAATVLKWAKHADPMCFMSESDKATLDALPDVITIYRGCSQKKAWKGLCWTLTREKAYVFASRYSDNKESGYVYRALIDKANVIAYTDCKDEQEVIVDYNKLLDLHQCERQGEIIND